MDEKDIETANSRAVDDAIDVNKQHTAELEVAQQATLQEAKSVRQTFQEDKKVFAVVAAALVGLRL